MMKKEWFVGNGGIDPKYLCMALRFWLMHPECGILSGLYIISCA